MAEARLHDMSDTKPLGGREPSRDLAQEWAEFEKQLAAEVARRDKSDALQPLEAEGLVEAAGRAASVGPAEEPARAPRGAGGPLARAREAPRSERHGSRRRFDVDRWLRLSPMAWVVAALAFMLGFAAGRALDVPQPARRAQAAGVHSETQGAMPRGTRPGERGEQPNPALKLDRNTVGLISPAAVRRR